MRTCTSTVHTLDAAAERFRANKVRGLAILYRNVALQYWEDEMIGDEALLAILHEIRDS